MNFKEFNCRSIKQIIISLGGILLLVILPVSAFATNYMVTSTADAGAGTLREAVANAVHLDTILFDSAIDADTIKLDSQIYTTQAILILGNGVDKTIISGQKKDRLFQFQYMGGPFVSIIISNIRMLDGNGIFTGGAIINQHFLELRNCIIQGCESGSGGAINNQGSLGCYNTIISGNKGNNTAGIFNNGTAICINMTMSGNSSTQQGGGFRNTSNGTATFRNCLIAANFDNGNGPDIWAHGSSTINDNGSNLIGDSTGVHNLFPNTTLKGGPANPLDPMFVEEVSGSAYPNNSGDLRLQCGSSAVNAGDSINISSSILGTDVFGNARYIGVVDIGAYEAGGNKKLTVLNSSDKGYGTFRNAVAASCDGDTICFHPDTDGQNIFMTSAKMEVEKNVTIIGNGIHQTIIDGDNTDHIMFSIKGHVQLHKLTIQDGGDYVPGIKMLNNGGHSLLINQCRIRDHRNLVNSNIPDGNDDNGGAIQAESPLTIMNSQISGNYSADGGAIYVAATTCTMINTTVTANQSNDDGTGIYVNSADLTMYNCILAMDAQNDIRSNIEIDNTNGGSVTAFNSFIGNGDGSGLTNGVDGNIVGSGASPADPIFVEPYTTSAPNDNGDFHLACGSPAINQGDSVGISQLIGAFDVEGISRYLDAKIDMGAFERPTGSDLLVTVTEDDVFGSLRYMVATACPGDTIKFAQALDGDTLKLAGTQITLDTNLVICGLGRKNLFIDANSDSRIFQVASGDTVAIKGITMLNGKGSGTGGGVENLGSLYLTDCRISYCTLTESLKIGGGIYNNGLLHLTNCEISHNSKTNIFTSRSALTGDFNGGGIYNDSQGILHGKNTLLAGNGVGGFGIRGDGGGLYNKGIADLINCSVLQNGALDTESGGKGGGIFQQNGSLSMINTLVAKNQADIAGYDIFHSGGTITDLGFNFVGDTTAVANLFSTTTLKGSNAQPLDPLLIDPLNNNFRLQQNSPALNRGKEDTTGLDLPVVDLDGSPRLSRVIDIGAYENPNTSCVPDMLITSDYSPLNGNYQATNSIIVGENVIATNGNMVELKGSSVEVSPNFSVEGGAELLIQNLTCK